MFTSCFCFICNPFLYLSPLSLLTLSPTLSLSLSISIYLFLLSLSKSPTLSLSLSLPSLLLLQHLSPLRASAHHKFLVCCHSTQKNKNKSNERGRERETRGANTKKFNDEILNLSQQYYFRNLATLQQSIFRKNSCMTVQHFLHNILSATAFCIVVGEMDLNFLN